MKLSSVFSDGLILQRDTNNIIWGYADSKSNIILKFNDKAYTAKADTEGLFEVEIPKMSAGGPYEIFIADGTSEILIKDIYFGDVFLLAGQSNMELPVLRTFDETEKYIKGVANPLIRQFELPKEYDFYSPAEMVTGGYWAKAEGKDINNFSALGYFFSEFLQRDEHIPIGLYQTACGGIQTEALISESRIKAIIPRLKSMAKEKGESKEKNCHCGKNNYCKFCIEEKMAEDINPQLIKKNEEELNSIYSEFYTWLGTNDEGINNHWEKRTSLYEASDKVKYINVPARWENISEYPNIEYIRGSVWLLKRFFVPFEYKGRGSKLSFGTVIDADETYINGELIGKTEYRYPPRRYDIPEGLLKAGENTLVVRIVASQRTGGTVPECPYEINIGDEYRILLNGPYEMRIGAAKEYKSKEEVVNMPDPTFYLFRPYGLYNKMIHPLRRQSLRAMLFYQGESNVGRDWDYVELCKEMVSGIRELFNSPTLPFVFVGLPYWGQEDDDRGTDKWDKFCAQQKSCLEIPNSAMADIYDLGFKYELHPQNKRAVAYRVYEAYKNIVSPTK